jgi:hypothetical protein
MSRFDPFGPTIFLGALLLFGSQPLVAKFLLPWFGGTPAVWTTCLLFFQGGLLAGYAYAHLVISRRDVPDQRRLHAVVLAAAVIAMVIAALFWRSPILPSSSWKPVGTDLPALRLIGLLTVAIGLPYVVLSTTGPLLQAWFSQTRPGVAPWRLYALSNLGSLLALVAYPTVIEPRITISRQAWLWAAGFLAYAIGCWLCARVQIPSAAPVVALPAAPAVDEPISVTPAEEPIGVTLADEPIGVTPADEGPSVPQLPPSGLRYLLWLVLAACPSLLLSATTNQMCQEVAPVPFLWVLPLALYLLSFVICFAGPRYYWRGLWQPVFALSLGFAYIVLQQGVSATFMAQMLAFPLALFAAAMVCHGELVRLRPDPSHLTGFYLTIAAGGAIGSGLVALAAPRFFDGFWELHVGFLVASVLAVIVVVVDQESWVYRRAPWPAVLAFGIVGALWVLPVDESFSSIRDAGRTWLADRRLYGIGVAALVPVAFVWRWRRPESFRRVSTLVSSVLLVAAVGLLGRMLVRTVESSRDGTVAVVRNFYGVIAVTDNDVDDPQRHRYVLQHGRIEHGHQLRAEELRLVPSSYYTESSGFGVAVQWHPRRAPTGDSGLHIGMVGLGVGGSAALAKPGDTIRFYEINQAVVDLSLGPSNLFTYLKECRGRVDVVLGDARLSLERELREGRPQQFDVLGIDAFSSDAIPTHLLTTQAIEIYLQHLRRPGGILAVHISNRYLNLEPVVRAAAAALALHVAVIDSRPGADRDPDASSSTWVLLAPDPETLTRPEIAEAANKEPGSLTRVWTDDFSNLLAAVSNKRIFH